MKVRFLLILLTSLLTVTSYAEELILQPGIALDEVKVKQLEEKQYQQALLKALKREEDQERLIKQKAKELKEQKELLDNLIRESKKPQGARKKIMDFAKAQLGKPYLWAATGPNKFDCSGLTMRAYESAQIKIPRHSLHQRNFGKIIPFDQAQAGDLIYVKGHIALYAGNNTILEAAGSGSQGQVKLTPLNNKWWQARKPVFVQIIK